jgi:tetratricopeptide (TPR) repeat protein
MQTSTIALAIALAGFTVSAPALAQYGSPPPPNTNTGEATGNRSDEERQEQPGIRSGSGGAASRSQAKAKEQQAADKLTSGRKLELSKEARQAIVELQAAVNANDTANIPTKLAAAQALAKNNDDKFIIATFQTKAALAANDLPGIEAGIGALQASGGAESADIALRYADLGKRYQQAKQNDQAAAAFEKSIAIDASSASALALLAGIRDTQGRKAEAVTLMQRSIAASKAKSQKVAEGNYKFAAKLAYDTKSPTAAVITREWVADYPSPQSWRDALRIYRDLNRPEGDAKIDILRLARAANALSGEADYHSLAGELVARGNLAEAKAVLDSARTAPNIDVTKQAFKDLSLKAAKAPTRAAIEASAKAALAGPSAKAAVDAGDALYGVGAYAEAAAAYRAALAKSGADANLINLRLGMALAQSGDKAGATAALNAVAGPQAVTAKYWQVWTAQRP